ncbi:MAG: hypothetical protein L0Y71_24785 [Gemmataceae bacterium]|nr:hypothetical protein [Gemmataceae bacterium]
MKTAFRPSFLHDLKKVKTAAILRRVLAAIENVEGAKTLMEIAHLKKLSGTKDCYRIRIGDWRLGVVSLGETVEFVRCLDRKDIYRYFPE